MNRRVFLTKEEEEALQLIMGADHPVKEGKDKDKKKKDKDY